MSDSELTTTQPPASELLISMEVGGAGVQVLSTEEDGAAAIKQEPESATGMEAEQPPPTSDHDEEEADVVPSSAAIETEQTSAASEAEQPSPPAPTGAASLQAAADQESATPRRRGPLINPGIGANPRSHQESAITRARARERLQTLEQAYWSTSETLKRNMKDTAELLQDRSASQHYHKFKKITLQGNFDDLAKILSELVSIEPSQDINEDFQTLQEGVESLLHQYRQLYPKPSSSAASSDITSSVASGASRTTFQHTMAMVGAVGTVMEEGERYKAEVEGHIQELQRRMREEQRKGDLDSAKARQQAQVEEEKIKRQVEEEKARIRQAEDRVNQQAEEEKVRLKQQAEEEKTRLKQEEDRAKKTAEDRLVQLKKQVEEQERQSREEKERVREGLQEQIESARLEKEALVSKYKDKQMEVMLQIAADIEDPAVTVPLPDLPTVSLLERFIKSDPAPPLPHDTYVGKSDRPPLAVGTRTIPSRLQLGDSAATMQSAEKKMPAPPLRQVLATPAETKQPEPPPHQVRKTPAVKEEEPTPWVPPGGGHPGQRRTLAASNLLDGGSPRRRHTPLWLAPALSHHPQLTMTAGTTTTPTPQLAGGLCHPPPLQWAPTLTTTTATATMASTLTVVPAPGPTGQLQQPPLPLWTEAPVPEAQNATQYPVIPYVPPDLSYLRPTAPPFPQPKSQPEQRHTQTTSQLNSVTQPREEETSLARTLVEAVRQNRLPPVEPTIFTGDPLLYPVWRSSFSLLIQQQNIPNTEKLLYLQRYVGGEARDAVTGYFLLRSDEALQQALDTLEKRYGNSYAIADAFREKLDSWPVVRNRDGEGLRRLGDFLRQSLVATQVVGQMTIFEDSRYHKSLLDRLPDWLQQRWAQIVHKVKTREERYPSFAELTRFVTDQAEIACDTVFGTGKTTKPATLPSSSTSSSANKRVSYSTDTAPAFTPVEMKSLRDILQREGQTVRNTMEGPGQDARRWEPRQFSPRGQQGQNGPPTGATTQECAFCKRRGHTHTACRGLRSRPLEERKTFFRATRLCYGCGVSTQHLARNCQRQESCRECQGPHLTVLHDDSKPLRADQRSQKSGEATQANGVGATRTQQTLSTTLARTSMVVPVLLSSQSDPTKEIQTYALLDTMSSLSFIDSHLAEQLSVTPVNTSLRLNTMTAKNELVPSQAIGGLRVRPLDSRNFVKLPLTHSTDNLSISPATIPTPDIAASHSHLRVIADKLHPLQKNVQAGLLLGYDCPEALMPIDIITGTPFAVRTPLGWSVIGDTPITDTLKTLCTAPVVRDREVTVTTAQTQTEDSQNQPPLAATVAYVYRTKAVEATTTDLLHLMERDFIEQEIGKRSQDEVKFLQIVEEKIKVNEDGKYEMPLPFRHGDPPLPDNRSAAVNRARTLRQQLMKNPKKREHYVQFMEASIADGYAERVPDLQIETPVRWYIPHHGVYNEKKPDKIRVVFDCSTRHRGECLNDHLLQGPDLINPLIGVLCRFRKGKIAFSCDIQQMFHQFYVCKPHRDYFRFLWWENGDLEGPLRDYRMRVHIFGATSSPGCANFGLKKIARDNSDVCPQASKFIQQNFYIDDGLHSEDEIDAAVKILEGAVEICKRGRMRLHKIVSNSQELLSHFPASEIRDAQQLDLGAKEEPQVERTLGLQWRIQEDTFSFTPEVKTKPVTRRGMLSTVATLYDPLGLISPIVLLGRIILQKMCRNQALWDDPPPPEVAEDWRRWVEGLSALHSLRIPRSFVSPHFGKTASAELHHFSDASEKGYGQCSYLRLKDTHGHVHCSLVMSKARVAPLKSVTIPRLELQAATLSVRMAEFLHNQLAYDSLTHHFWTDSEIVLAYIANTQKQFHVFVANRVSQIRSFSKPCHWSHVTTDRNPADMASRGKEVAQLQSSCWYEGPPFLWQPEVPKQEEEFAVQPDDVEVRRCMAAHEAQATFVTMEKRFARFSSLQSLLRAFGLLLRALARRGGRELTPVQSWELAEQRLITIAQKNFLARPSPQLKNSMEQLNCRKSEEDLVVVRGRISAPNRRREVSVPILLPKDSHLTVLIATDCHVKTGHSGRTTTIHEMRARGFWVIGIRRLVASILRGCVLCLRHHAPFLQQRMADLPADRVTPGSPFDHCGMDCFGPFLVREGRRTVKRWGLIVTCLRTRAVHLEVLDNMSTDAFLDALRRVVAIRGNIRQIRCDRGTNFVGASRELKRAWAEVDQERLNTVSLQTLSCEWTFNTPNASHQGGVWERLIRSARRILAGLMGTAAGRLEASTLRTLLYEVMAVMNSRPLSVESLEDPTGPLPLTPNHILTAKSTGVCPPPGVFCEADLFLRKQWRKAQFLADRFWQKWRDDYLVSLQQRRKWLKMQPNLAKGDVVLLSKDLHPRSSWRMALVEEAIPGDDGLVRTCILRAPRRGEDGGSGAITRMERPVTKLVLLLSPGNPSLSA